VGNDGTVWAFRWDRKETGRWKRLFGTKVKGNYLRVQLHNDSGPQMFLIHRLVLEAFVGPCPLGKESCHEDDEPSNNQKGNLRWDVRKENMKDRKRNRMRKGLSPWYDNPRAVARSGD